jgi:hypothetical protein
MANSLGLNNNAVAGLGTFSYTVVAAGMYTVSCQSTLPYEQGTYNDSSVIPAVASALQIVINQNGNPVVTIGGSSQNPTPTQPAMGTSARIQAAAGDVLSVVLSSANAIDNQPNSVKSNINVFFGE